MEGGLSASASLSRAAHQGAGEGAHRFRHSCRSTRADGYPWDAEIATLPIVGGYMTEVEFFHRESRTLILTDLIENFEPEKARLASSCVC